MMLHVLIALSFSSAAPTFDADQLLVAGEQYVQNGQGKKAVPVLTKAIAAGTLKPPEHARALTALGVAKSQLGDNDGAVKLFEEAIEKNPADDKPYLMLGMTYDITERFQEARAAYQRGVDKFPKNAQLNRELGATELLLGDAVKAVEHLGVAMKKIDDDSDLMRDYGAALLASGKAADAVKVLQDARQMDPENAQVAFTLADALAGSGRTEDALSNYDDATKLDPNHAPAQFHKGLLLSKQGDTAGAIVAYRKALKIDPTLIRAKLALGVALARTNGQDAEAMNVLKAVLEKDPSFAEAHAQLGLLLEKKGDLAGAEEALTNATARRENDPKLWKDLARIQDKRGKKKESAASLKNAQKSDKGAGK